MSTKGTSGLDALPEVETEAKASPKRTWQNLTPEEKAMATRQLVFYGFSVGNFLGAAVAAWQPKVRPLAIPQAVICGNQAMAATGSREYQRGVAGFVAAVDLCFMLAVNGMKVGPPILRGSGTWIMPAVEICAMSAIATNYL